MRGAACARSTRRQGGAEDRERRRNAQRIGQARPMQQLADRPVVGVFDVGDHGGQVTPAARARPTSVKVRRHFS
jgi:hypothetical protein